MVADRGGARPAAPGRTATGRLLALGLAVVAVGAAACTGDPEPDRPAAAPAQSSTGSPTGASPSASATPTVEVPLAVAVHPTRDGLRLTAREVRRLASGGIRSWADLGEPGRRLVVGSLADARRSRAAVALVPVGEVGPRVGVARVDGVDPVRDPRSYRPTVGVPGRSGLPGRVTTVTVTGDMMLGRRVGDRLAAVGDPAAALRPLAGRLARADLTIGNLESTLSQAGAPRQGGDSFGASTRGPARPPAGRLRRAVPGQQPHR